MSIHIMSHKNCGMGTGRMRVIDIRLDGKRGEKAQKAFYRAFPTCSCKTLEVEKWYDCSQILHRKSCAWLWYKRKRHPRSRHAWTTS